MAIIDKIPVQITYADYKKDGAGELEQFILKDASAAEDNEDKTVAGSNDLEPSAEEPPNSLLEGAYNNSQQERVDYLVRAFGTAKATAQVDKSLLSSNFSNADSPRNSAHSPLLHTKEASLNDRVRKLGL